MREFTVRPRMGRKNFEYLEGMVGGAFPASFTAFMTKYAGMSLEEDFYKDASGNAWIVAAYDNFVSMHSLTKEFKENGWGLKVPFAYDGGGWHFCLSFDAQTMGKVLINRWTDHSPEEQFLVIADGFETFVNGLARAPAGFSERP
jgi:hypothetical protein